MFTGIITDVGDLLSVQDHASTRRIEVACRYPLASIALGASIANAGICLTVTQCRQAGSRTVFAADASAETLHRTTLGTWQVGDRINLERSLRVGDELGGHIVSGHVDGVADILARQDRDGTAQFTVRAARQLAKFIAEKGSVALNGTSLTVNSVSGDCFTVTLVPHSLSVTTWGVAKPGDRVNLEIDTLARYAARLAEASAAGY